MTEQLKLPKGLRCWFEFHTTPWDTSIYRWFVMGQECTMELCIRTYKLDDRIEWQGGVETHLAVPPDHEIGNAPDHDKCHARGGQSCWHDGTSLWASEFWIPMFHGMNRDPIEMLQAFANHIESRARETAEQRKAQEAEVPRD